MGLVTSMIRHYCVVFSCRKKRAERFMMLVNLPFTHTHVWICKRHYFSDDRRAHPCTHRYSSTSADHVGHIGDLL